jgi:hypothetical protein
MPKPTSIAVVAATVVALFATLGSAYWLGAGEMRKKPYPKATPPPPPSPIYTPSKERAPTAAEIETAAREHNAQLSLEIERALVARNPQQRETAFTFLLPELLQLEPERAVTMVAAQEPGETRDTLRNEVARQWITRDRDAAIKWMKSLPPAEQRESAQVAVRTLAAIAPDQAIYVADEFGVGRDDGSLEHMVQIWAEGNLPQAERWLATQPNDARTAPLRVRIEQVRKSRVARESQAARAAD